MTYEAFFNLKDEPFRLTPDVDYFFPSEVHSEALETLLYSIKAGEGFVQVTGEPGVGKTLVVRSLLKKLGDGVETALILHPRLGPEELLKVILVDLGMDAAELEKKSKEALLRSFREYLLDKGQRGITTAVIIDEAQDIPDDTLEELRLLSNLETEKKKLLSIILVGQLELEDNLNSAHLKQLCQRITIRYRLKAFTRQETAAYIQHRLKIAGSDKSARFPERILKKIYQLSDGIPRRINIICERALMAACVEGEGKLQTRHLKYAMRSLTGEKSSATRRRGWRWAAGVTAVVLVAAAAGWFFYGHSPRLRALVDKTLTERIASRPEELASASTSPAAVKPEAPDQSQGDVAAERKAPEAVSLPSQVDFIPADWYFLSLDARQKTVRLWRGGDPTGGFMKAFELADIPLPAGFYLLGKDSRQRRFVFNHLSFSPWRRYAAFAEELWEKVDLSSSGPVIPLLVTSLQKPLSAPEENRAIRRLVKQWADAWRSLDIERFIQFYGKTFISFRPFRNKPVVLSRRQYYRRKKRLFEKSGFVSLQLSEPVCVVDPANTGSAAAVFYQRYTSASYVDEGVKALYFRLVQPEKGGAPQWRIEGRFWLPLPAK